MRMIDLSNVIPPEPEDPLLKLQEQLPRLSKRRKLHGSPDSRSPYPRNAATPRGAGSRVALPNVEGSSKAEGPGGATTGNTGKPPVLLASTKNGLSLRSQLHALDSDMLRTFDSKTGLVQVNHKSSIPKRTALIREKYLGFWKDDKKVQEAEELVGRLSMSDRQKCAINSIRRRHQEELNRILKKDVFDSEVAVSRINISMQMAFEHIIGHLGTDTRELSYIRMQAAAADDVLWREAERMADAEIQHFQATVIPAGTTAVELMSLAIDSYRERYVPAPPRQFAKTETASPPQFKQGSSRLARRPSGIYHAGSSSPSPLALQSFGLLGVALPSIQPSCSVSRPGSPTSMASEGIRSLGGGKPLPMEPRQPSLGFSLGDSAQSGSFGNRRVSVVGSDTSSVNSNEKLMATARPTPASKERKGLGVRGQVSALQ
jgi:hypothetical protein